MDDIQLLRKMKVSEGQVKAVLFDLGGTLVNIDNSKDPHVMKRILGDCGVNRSLEDVSREWVKSWERLNFREMPKLLDEFWVQQNLRVLRNLRLGLNAEKLARFIASHWWDYAKVSLYPDAQEMLPHLKEKGLKIGLVTNGLKSDTNKILPQVGLQGFFDVMVVVDTLRKMKPDAEVFRYALEKMNAKVLEAVFVGDDMEADYKGAQRCGLSAFLIDREGKVQDESVNRISSLEDLLEPSQEDRLFQQSPILGLLANKNMKRVRVIGRMHRRFFHNVIFTD
jgi:2-haloalkanoic acid dehalogenase type II